MQTPDAGCPDAPAAEHHAADAPPDPGAAVASDPAADNLARLRALFPQVVTERLIDGRPVAAVDVEALRALVGECVATGADEPYGLHWPGKRHARALALAPARGTLLACPGEGLDADTSAHLVIEGDNLEVLKRLHGEYAGRIKLIYIDPPYNTGRDFVYRDRHHAPVHGARAGPGDDAADGERRHSGWLNMLYPRLLLTRPLLAPDGVLAVHIDEHEQPALTLMLRELYGEDNELGLAVWDKRNPKGDARGIAYQHESLLLYARDAATLLASTPLRRPKRNAQRMLDAARRALADSATPAEAEQRYRAWLKAQTTLSGGEAMYKRLAPDGRVYRLVSMAWPNKQSPPAEYFEPLIHPRSGQPCPVPVRGWRNPPATMRRLLDAGLIEFGPDESVQPQRIYYLDENLYENVPSVLPHAGSDDALLRELGIPFDQPKPVDFAAAVIGWCTSGDDLVLDCFAGSGTTAHAVLKLNAADGGRRRYLLVQQPEPLDPAHPGQRAAAAFCARHGLAPNLAELLKERLRRSARQLRAAAPDQDGDTGFRVWRCVADTDRA